MFNVHKHRKLAQNNNSNRIQQFNYSISFKYTAVIYAIANQLDMHYALYCKKNKSLNGFHVFLCSMFLHESTTQLFQSSWFCSGAIRHFQILLFVCLWRKNYSGNSIIFWNLYKCMYDNLGNVLLLLYRYYLCFAVWEK